MDYLKLPFTQFDTAYLESLPDEVFFARRFKMSDEDEALLLENSSVINGRRFYRAKISEPLMKKYASLTNPKEGEPGTRSNPLVRFGKEYIYSDLGELILYRRGIWFEENSTLTGDQKKMIQDVVKMPITYGADCPKSSKERLERFGAFGKRRNQEREAVSSGV